MFDFDHHHWPNDWPPSESVPPCPRVKVPVPASGLLVSKLSSRFFDADPPLVQVGEGAAIFAAEKTGCLFISVALTASVTCAQSAVVMSVVPPPGSGLCCGFDAVDTSWLHACGNRL